MQFHAVVHGEPAGPEDHFLAHGIDGMDGHREVGGFAPVLRPLVELDAFALLLGRDFLVETVQDDEGNVGAYAHFHRRLPREGGEPVHVVEGGGAAADHFQAGRLRAPVDELFVHLRFHFPDLREPFVQGDVFGNAPEHDHGRMGVHVDETRDDGLAGAVHGLVGDEAVRLGEGEDAADAGPFDEQVHRGAGQLYVPQKNHSPK